jgi:hypothetical protein
VTRSIRVRVSVSHACGSTVFSKQVSINQASTAEWVPPPSEPANGAFLRLKTSGRIVRSTVLLLISTWPSSR